MVYDSYGNERRHCPLCQAITDAETKEEDLRAELDSAQSKNVELEAAIEDLRGEVAALQAEAE